MKKVGVVLSIIAYLTLVQNIFLVLFMVQTHFANAATEASPDQLSNFNRTTFWGMEFTTFASEDAPFMIAIAVWTTLLALAYIFRDRFPKTANTALTNS